MLQPRSTQHPAIVFLHGGSGNRYNWRSQYEFFQSQGRAVLAYDLAGHGQSSPYKRYSRGYNFFRRHGSWLPNIPVLVITGGQDPMFTAQMGEELAAYFPQGRHLHLYSAGHWVMAEYPEKINQAIAALMINILTCQIE